MQNDIVYRCGGLWWRLRDSRQSCSAPPCCLLLLQQSLLQRHMLLRCLLSC